MSFDYHALLNEGYARMPQIAGILPQGTMLELLGDPQFVRSAGAPLYRLVYVQMENPVQAWLCHETRPGKSVFADAVRVVTYTSDKKVFESNFNKTENRPVFKQCIVLDERNAPYKEEYAWLNTVFKKACAQQEPGKSRKA